MKQRGVLYDVGLKLTTAALPPCDPKGAFRRVAMLDRRLASTLPSRAS